MYSVAQWTYKARNTRKHLIVWKCCMFGAKWDEIVSDDNAISSKYESVSI